MQGMRREIILLALCLILTTVAFFFHSMVFVMGKKSSRGSLPKTFPGRYSVHPKPPRRSPTHLLEPSISRMPSCSDYGQYLAIYVHSAPRHFFRRRLMRKTWGSPNVLAKLNASMVFIIGQSDNHKYPVAVSREFQSSSDIVRGNFVDTYKNISLKALTGLEWATEYCKHARYLLKTDDDIFVDIFALVRHLVVEMEEFEDDGGLLLCNLWNSGPKVIPNRRETDKWYVSYDEYNGTEFPAFCQGAAYLITPDVAAALYQKSADVRRLWLDDVFLTGVLREAVGVTPSRLNEAYKEGSVTPFRDLVAHVSRNEPLFVHGLGMRRFVQLWEHVKRLKSNQSLENLIAQYGLGDV